MPLDIFRNFLLSWGKVRPISRDLWPRNGLRQLVENSSRSFDSIRHRNIFFQTDKNITVAMEP
jgi:hypothetical protein